MVSTRPNETEGFKRHHDTHKLRELGEWEQGLPEQINRLNCFWIRNVGAESLSHADDEFQAIEDPSWIERACGGSPRPGTRSESIQTGGKRWVA